MSQQKRISAGCRVAGSFGPLVPNPRGHKRRIRQKVYGTVVRAVDMGRWEVLFDFDAKKQICSVKQLSVVNVDAGVPVEELQPPQPNNSSVASDSSNTSTTSTAPSAVVEEEADASNFDASDDQEDDPLGVEEDGDCPLDEVDEQEDMNMPNNDFCFDEDDFIAYKDGMNLATQHLGKQREAWNKIRAMEGEEYVANTSNDGSITWKVVKEVVYDEMSKTIEKEIQFLKKNISLQDGTQTENLNGYFWYMYPGNASDDLVVLNASIDAENESRKERYQRVIRKVNCFYALFVFFSF